MSPTEQADALEAARKAGIDLSLVDSNLALTYEQRALQHDSALELVLELRKAGGVHEQPQASSHATH